MTVAPTAVVTARPGQRPTGRFAPALESVLVLLLFLAALVVRLPNLDLVDGTSFKADEGIHGEAFLLMRAGFRPLDQIFLSQGPLYLQVHYPLFELFGGSLWAARFSVALASLVGLAGVWWLGRLIGGPPGGLLAALLCALSPAYLAASRRNLTEAMALAPAILAVAAAFQYRRQVRPGWLAGAGMLLAIGIAIKPIVLPAAAPLGLLALGAGRCWRRDTLLLVASVGLTLLSVVLLVGPAGVVQQIVEFRLQVRQARGWSPADNWATLSGVLDGEPLALFVLAFVGALALLRLAPGLARPLLGWLVVSFGLLLLHSPLFPKHPVILVPPLAALAAGLGLLWDSRQGLPRLFQPALALGSGLLLVTLPAALVADGRLAGLDPSAPPIPSAAANQASTIAALTLPDRYVLTDTPFLPFLADRLVPPSLTDLSSTRISAGALSTDEIIAAADRFPVSLAVLRSDWFRQMAGFNAWLDREFVLVRTSGRGATTPDVDLAPFLYLRRPLDLGAARAALTDGLTERSGAEFDQQLRLLRYSLAETPAGRGRRLSLAVEWETLAAPAGDPRAIVQLIGSTGRPVDSAELPFGDGIDGPAGWPPGRWLVQQAYLTLPPGRPPGEYRLVLGVFDAVGRRPLAVSRAPDAPLAVGERTITLWRTGGE